MDGFVIKYKDVNSLLLEYKENLELLITKIEDYKGNVQSLIDNAGFEGEGAESIKSYMDDVHITLLSSLQVTAQTMLDSTCVKISGNRYLWRRNQKCNRRDIGSDIFGRTGPESGAGTA